MASAQNIHPPSSILHPRPILIAGPTATGKSEIALRLAERIGGEIISVDSMQVYRGLDIGTAKSSVADRARIPHHLIDVVELTQPFDAAKFVTLANQAVREIQSRGRVPVLCGGTGLYFKAFLDGLGEAPPSDAALRAELEATPQESLLRELSERDPATFEKIDRQNPRRVIRAVEVIRLTGRPFSEQRSEWNHAPSLAASNRSEDGNTHHGTLFVGINRTPDDLHRRCNARVDEMFQRGLVEETRRLLEHGLAQNQTALQAIGYRQVAEHLRGERPLDQTIELVKSRTRQFAKRQLTWFRKHAQLTWIEIAPQDSVAEVLTRIVADVGVQASACPSVSNVR